MDNEETNTTAAPPSTPGPLLVFILGAPCSGKSTLSAALSTRHNLTPFSLGADLRSLVSPHPTGAALRIAPLFSAAELASFRAHLHTGTLGPAHLAARYVGARVFPAGCDPTRVRMVVDGFPRDAGRWGAFKGVVEPVWRPGEGGVLVVLDVERGVARERFVRRGRAGDVFERRFDEHVELVEGVVQAMGRDGVKVWRVRGGEELQAVVQRLGAFLGEEVGAEGGLEGTRLEASESP
ncbi:hypothetical protein C7974DRAFT_427026 [Boeremia exigua]|uniref:uncharacterized protein n=1 Tax=Boeremia exigua TaxID=749465 RepID=UPI001E8E8EBB|nr:uncharacterized protein C7974DRAFT_427026 [Boeremia exigua]KAH6618775.1 hypothetical protein C7974DRAFT_427026 [Boeremia exigua]